MLNNKRNIENVIKHKLVMICFITFFFDVIEIFYIKINKLGIKSYIIENKSDILNM